MLGVPVLEYISRMIIRKSGFFEPRFADNLRRSVRRNFGVKVSQDEVRSFMSHYTAAYDFAVAALPPFIGPKRGKEISDEDVRKEDFVGHIGQRYPAEPREVLENIAGYAILYAYLK